MGVYKFRDGKVHFRNLRMKGLLQINHSFKYTQNLQCGISMINGQILLTPYLNTEE